MATTPKLGTDTAPAARPPSPCIGVCRLEADTGLCTGCLRTLDEIATWGRLDAAGREPLWLAIEARRRLRPA